MLRKLVSLGLVEHERYRGARLTEQGRRVALEVIRHHRLLELYLVESLGMSWDEVHAEAEVLEHALSEELEELISSKLGHPTTDPHGDPIPTRELTLEGLETSQAVRARAGNHRHADAGLGLGPGNAPLPCRARDCAGDEARGARAAAVRRPPLRSRRRRGSHPRRDARPGDESQPRGCHGGHGDRDAAACPRSARAARHGNRRRLACARRGAERSRHAPTQRPAPRRRSRCSGPAFVASIAYVDPGNFATNIQGGAEYGYLLLWVVLAANLVAMLIQYLSAKLGIVTGQNLPELCRATYPRPVAWGLWLQAELIAMSTDVAELIGAALGLNLLFHVPLFIAGLMGGVIAFGVLELHRHGYRRFEIAISALLGLVLLGFLYETLAIGPSASASARGLIPHLAGTQSVYLAVGIIGATVMPHAIYLHSALVQGRVAVRNDRERRRVLRFARVDVIVALGLAGLINLSMLAVAAKLFHTKGHAVVDTIQGAHTGFEHLVGGSAALAFAVALLASGISSSSVGTYAGQVVMAGFVNLQIPLFLRRAITMIPALIVLGVGVSPTSALVASQVILSFGIPFALIPLVRLTSRRDIMGAHVNRRPTSIAAWSAAGLIVALNVFLIARQLGGI